MTSNVVKLPARDGLVARVAENVRVQCAVRGWNQSDLARAIGVAPNTISKRWYGARQWQLEDLDLVADALGVDTDVLLRARRDSNPQPSDLESVAEVYDFATGQRVA